MRILVIEDERTLAGFIEQSLQAEGHAVTVAYDGESGEAAARTGDYALVLLDLMLPGKNGLDVLSAIRAQLPELPVIVLTARAAVEQKVQGLDRGANDYVTKPFSFEELLARVRAQLRGPGQRESSVLEAGDIRMDLRTRRVERDGREIPLTAREFEVLGYLLRHPDQVLSREQILNAVWGYDFDPGTKVLGSTSGTCGASWATGTALIRSRRCATSATDFVSRVRPRLTGGLRTELALAIALVTAVGVGASFLALYGGTGSGLRAQIDAQLRTQAAEWHQTAVHADLSSPRAVEAAGRRFLSAQRYHAEALIIVVQARGGHTVSNASDVVAREGSRERSQPETAGLLDARLGLTTAQVAEAGDMRILSEPIIFEGRRVGTLRVADPLTPVSDAQSSLLRTFAVVGGLALALAIVVGIALATVIAAPLRRMARAAAAVEAGDLSVRTGPVHARGEIGLLRSHAGTAPANVQTTARLRLRRLTRTSHPADGAPGAGRATRPRGG
jgi:DNA-binding response OmpR family regulator/HAMP domain-containing protein